MPFFVMAISVYIPTSSPLELPFLHILANTCNLLFFVCVFK